MTKRYKSYLKHAAVWVALVLLAGWIFALPLQLVGSLVVQVAIIMAIWKIDELVVTTMHNKYKQEIVAFFLLGVGVTILLGTIGLLIYFRPKVWGGMMTLTVLTPLVILVVEYIIAIKTSAWDDGQFGLE